MSGNHLTFANHFGDRTNPLIPDGDIGIFAWIIFIVVGFLFGFYVLERSRKKSTNELLEDFKNAIPEDHSKNSDGE
jgi:hypothetical protein